MKNPRRYRLGGGFNWVSARLLSVPCRQGLRHFQPGIRWAMYHCHAIQYVAAAHGTAMTASVFWLVPSVQVPCGPRPLNGTDVPRSVPNLL
jgi:hypothetical protein